MESSVNNSQCRSHVNSCLIGYVWLISVSLMAACSLDCKNERPSRTFRRRFRSVQFYVRRTSEIHFVGDHFIAFRITMYFFLLNHRNQNQQTVLLMLLHFTCS